MKTLAILAVLAVGGCATSADCGPDWRAIGERDGRINAGPQAAGYAAPCGKPVDSAAYEEGYRLGFARRPIPNW